MVVLDGPDHDEVLCGWDAICEEAWPTFGTDRVVPVIRYSGYDDDPRSVWEIPEFVGVVAEVAARHPEALAIDALWSALALPVARIPALVVATCGMERVGSLDGTGIAERILKTCTADKADPWGLGLAKRLEGSAGVCRDAVGRLLGDPASCLPSMVEGMGTTARQALDAVLACE